MTKLRSVADKPRHYQYATTQSQSIIPFGFTADGAGVILSSKNPPQIFVTAGANDQEYLLKVPNGNPDKVWVYVVTDTGIAAAVTDYSTVATTGVLVINLAAAPTVNTEFSGFIVYGQVASEPSGDVFTAPTGSAIDDVRSHAQFCAKSLLQELMIVPLRWETPAAGSAQIIHVAPLGTTVEEIGSGVYDITFDFSEPHNFQTNWSVSMGSSDGRAVNAAVQTSTDNSFVLRATFVDVTDMAPGDFSNLILIGSPKGSDPRYGATLPGGVHSDLATRDIHLYTHYKQLVAVRASSFYPLSVTMGATTTGPVLASSNIPANLLIERTGVGVYVIYIGRFPPEGVAAAFEASDGTAVGVTAVDGEAGTLTVTAAAELSSDTLSGWIVAKTQNQD